MESSRNSAFAFIAVAILTAGVLVGAVAMNTEPNHPEIRGEVIGYDSGYKSPIFDISYEDFTNAGYSYGDTFNVTVKGVTLYDAILINNYMGVFMFDTYINIYPEGKATYGYCTAGSMWNSLLPGEAEGSEVVIKYAGHSTTYSRLDKFLVKESDDRSQYPSDEAFANFNMITGGSIKEGKLFRSFSPFSASGGSLTARSQTVNLLAQQNGIKFDVALSYSETAISSAPDCYCKGISHVAPQLGYRYFIQTEQVKQVLVAMAENDGPYLVHCNVGRDRSGFMTTLLMALCGATEQQMATTAAQPYVNLYHVDPNSAEYITVMLNTYYRNMYFIQNTDMIDLYLKNGFLPIDWSDKRPTGIDTKKAAHDFCINYIGITETQVNAIITHLSS